MKFVFIPCPEHHRFQTGFPLCFRVSVKLSIVDEINFGGVPYIMVHDNANAEIQLPANVDFEVDRAIDTCLRVRCRVEKAGAVSQAIRAALIKFSPDFEKYQVEARFKITPATNEEKA